MKATTRLPTAIILLAGPVAAYAQGGAPHIELYALGGGLVGGFLGALLACLFCCRKSRGSKDEIGVKKY
jgi:hypothetical protein